MVTTRSKSESRPVAISAVRPYKTRASPNASNSSFWETGQGFTVEVQYCPSTFNSELRVTLESRL